MSSDRSFLSDYPYFCQIWVESGCSYAEMSRRTGIPRTTIADAGKRMRAEIDMQPSSCDSCAPAHIKMEKQANELVKLRKINKTLANHAGSFEKALKFLTDTVVPIQDGKPYISPAGSSALVSSWNDWHFGSVTDKSSVNDLYEFSPRIMQDRSFQIIDHISDQIDAHDLDEVVIVLNGDMFNAMTQLHPDESTDPDRIAVQARDCASLVCSRLYDLNHRFPTVHFRVLGNRGNHTRSTLKSPTSATDFGLSWEMLFFELVKAAGPQDFSYHSDQSYRQYFHAGGVWWVSAHGHHFSGGGGATHMPEASIKKFCEDADWALRELHDGAKLGGALFGHYHRWYSSEWRNVTAFVAPSPKGPDSFGRDKINDYTYPAYLSVRCGDGHIKGMDLLRF